MPETEPDPRGSIQPGLRVGRLGIRQCGLEVHQHLVNEWFWHQSNTITKIRHFQWKGNLALIPWGYYHMPTYLSKGKKKQSSLCSLVQEILGYKVIPDLKKRKKKYLYHVIKAIVSWIRFTPCSYASSIWNGLHLGHQLLLSSGTPILAGLMPYLGARRTVYSHNSSLFLSLHLAISEQDWKHKAYSQHGELRASAWHE